MHVSQCVTPGVLSAAILLATVLAQDPRAAQPEMDASALMRRVAKNNMLARERREEFSYRLRIKKFYLDGAGAVQRTAEETREVTGRQRDTFSVETAGARSGGAKRTEFKEVCDFATMLPNYTWTPAGETSFDGEPCWLVRYDPKPNLPYTSREEKIMNHTGGTLWISKRQEQVVRNRASLLRPVSVAWFVATAESIEFDYVAQRLPNGDWGPASLEYEFRVRIPFGSLRQRERREMDRYSRNPEQRIHPTARDAAPSVATPPARPGTPPPARGGARCSPERAASFVWKLPVGRGVPKGTATNIPDVLGS
ncbi:MAG: hypothetical protein IT577_14665 [Verrucomicrobiae bacterium]|nr:hypothetical protein [Verrucomicrobiae bacterium]